jgi:hypothetical protein
MSIVGTALLLMAGALMAMAQDQCSLTVKVADPNGNKVSGAFVWVEERNGRLEYRKAERGEAAVCELGFLGVTVTVGSAGCNQVVVRDVPLEWAKDQTVNVTYDQVRCGLNVDHPAMAVCEVLFRFADAAEDSKWIPGVEFKPPLRGRQSLGTDRFGRALVRMSAGEEIHASTESAGYAPEAIDLKCTNNLIRVERLVKLRKSH